MGGGYYDPKLEILRREAAFAMVHGGYLGHGDRGTAVVSINAARSPEIGVAISGHEASTWVPPSGIRMPGQSCGGCGAPANARSCDYCGRKHW